MHRAPCVPGPGKRHGTSAGAHGETSVLGPGGIGAPFAGTRRGPVPEIRGVPITRYAERRLVDGPRKPNHAGLWPAPARRPGERSPRDDPGGRRAPSVAGVGHGPRPRGVRGAAASRPTGRRPGRPYREPRLLRGPVRARPRGSRSHPGRLAGRAGGVLLHARRGGRGGDDPPSGGGRADPGAGPRGAFLWRRAERGDLLRARRGAGAANRIRERHRRGCAPRSAMRRTPSGCGTRGVANRGDGRAARAGPHRCRERERALPHAFGG